VWFENRGRRDTDILADAETVLRFPGKYPTLKGILGDHGNNYRPYALDVAAQRRSFESNSGRATHVNFPYFDLEYGDSGVMLAIGWAGTWRADFRYNGKKQEVEYRARAVNRLHTRLKPGEKIRTAMFVRAPYMVRNEDAACNYWRSWFIARCLPPADGHGTPLHPFSTCCLASDTGRPNSDGSISEGYDTWRPSLEKMIGEDVNMSEVKQPVVPIWEKYSLSVEEAAEYYGIGEKRLRSIAAEHYNDGFILSIGAHVRFKRRLFEEYLDMAFAV
jgi:hypothetical protein